MELKIILEIKGQKQELTIDELKKLRDDILEVMPLNEQIPIQLLMTPYTRIGWDKYK